MSQIHLVPVNSIESTFLMRLALCLEERFVSSCRVEQRVRVARTALNSDRNQLFLNALVTKVAHAVPDTDGLALAVTDFDLYKTSHQFIFGDASEDERVAVVSMHRLRSEFYGERSDDNALFQRTLKEAVHNLGHAIGLRHCFNARCAMFYSNSIYEIDNKVAHFCVSCERKVPANH